MLSFRLENRNRFAVFGNANVGDLFFERVFDFVIFVKTDEIKPNIFFGRVCGFEFVNDFENVVVNISGFAGVENHITVFRQILERIFDRSFV